MINREDSVMWGYVACDPEEVTGIELAVVRFLLDSFLIGSARGWAIGSVLDSYYGGCEPACRGFTGV